MGHIYTVVEATNLEALIDQVNQAMRDGWRSEGGVCCIKVENRADGLQQYRFLQAMERRVLRG